MQLAERRRRTEEQDRLSSLLSRYHGRVLSAEDISEIGGKLTFGLSITPRQGAEVRRLLLPHVGRPLDEERIQLLSEKLSALSPRLARGERVQSVITEPEETEVLCTEVSVSDPSMYLKIRDGTLAGETICRHLTPNFLQWLGMKIGLKGRQYHTFHPREMFGMQWEVVLEKNEKLEIEIARFNVPDSLRRKNVQLRRDRQRAGCEVPCFWCPAGTERCDLSTHQEDWTEKQCSEGHSAWFDEHGCLRCREEEYCRYAGITEKSFLPH